MAVSNTMWSMFTQADYSIEQWRRAALVDTGQGETDSKERYKVPVREPDGTLNRNAVHAAAGGHGLGAVKGISDETRQAAARKLVGLYRDELDEEPPDSVMMMAGMRSLLPDLSGSSLGEPLYRSFTPDLHVRSSGDGRTVCGIAVPWGAAVRIDDTLVEQFARGAFNHQFAKPSRIKYAREHMLLGGELIGNLSLMRDDAAGQYVEMRVSRTPKGDETLELVKDGALDQLSVMFRERQNRRLGGGVIERVKADLVEVASVFSGAYGELAMAVGVRSAQIPVAASNLDLRARAEEYLLDSSLPDLPDHELTIRALRLGMPV